MRVRRGGARGCTQGELARLCISPSISRATVSTKTRSAGRLRFEHVEHGMYAL